MSIETVTIDSKQYKFECLDAESQEYVSMLAEVKQEISVLRRKIKVLTASEITLSTELGLHLEKSNGKRTEIKEPDKENSGEALGSQ